jgi:polar amino acid transport system substrate-binding protein
MRLVTLIAGFLLATPALAVDDLDRILAQGVVRAGVCLTAEPIGFRDSNGAPRGFEVDVAQMLAEQLGVQLEIVDVTASTRIPVLLSGGIDVIICNLTANTDRAKAISFSFPYMRTGLRLLVKRDSGFDSIDDLDPRTRIVVHRSTTGEALALERAPDSPLIFTETPGDAVLLLRADRAEAYIEDSLLVDAIAQQFPQQFVALPEIYSTDAVSIGVRKGNPEFLRWLDLFASTFISSGAYAELYDRWWGGEPPRVEPVW